MSPTVRPIPRPLPPRPNPVLISQAPRAVTVLDNPTHFTNPFQFEITFECLEPLNDGARDTPLRLLLRREGPWWSAR